MCGRKNIIAFQFYITPARPTDEEIFFFEKKVIPQEF